MRYAAPIVLIAALTACNPGDEVSTTLLAGGTFVLQDADPAVTLFVDVSALTFTLEEDGGDSVAGTLERVDEAEWAECCYLNGSGHSEFETFRLEPATFTVGPVDLADAALTAVPTLQEFTPSGDANEGYAFN